MQYSISLAISILKGSEQLSGIYRGVAASSMDYSKEPTSSGGMSWYSSLMLIMVSLTWLMTQTTNRLSMFLLESSSNLKCLCSLSHLLHLLHSEISHHSCYIDLPTFFLARSLHWKVCLRLVLIKKDEMQIYPKHSSFVIWSRYAMVTWFLWLRIQIECNRSSSR